MNMFWQSVILPALRICAPKTLLEIGSNKGATTRPMLTFARETGAVAHVIDPAPRYKIEQWQSEWGDTLVYHRALSLDALPKIGAVDVALIDGDHNYYTVLNELRLIHAQTAGAGKPFPFTVLHDVAWPYGRRDVYYAPDTIPAEHRHPHRRHGVVPGQSQLAADGQGMNVGIDHAEFENTPRNGVRTAVEDFIEETSGDFAFNVIPAFFGLGLLYRRSDHADDGPLARFLATLPVEGLGYALVEQAEGGRLNAEVAKRAAERRAKAAEEQVEALEKALSAARAGQKS